MAEDRDERAGRLLRIGLDVAVRIRDGDRADVVRDLDALDYTEMRDLVLLLAGCVDIDRHIGDLVWWTEDRLTALPRARPGLPPCGTPRGYRRHIERGESADVACELAYLRHESERKRLSQASTATVHTCEAAA